MGRHIEHDPRSKEYPFLAKAGERKAVLHKRHAKILDQGRIGSCTGNALEGALGSAPLHKPFERHTEQRAVALYSLATSLDGFQGDYPPEDTGSSGLAVCKAAVQLKRLTGYRWAFGLEQALDALQAGPVITGVAWYQGFDRPDGRGKVSLSGGQRGGHEFLVRGYDPERSEVFCDNSWGEAWGLKGSFRMTTSDWGTLLEQRGDVTVPLR